MSIISDSVYAFILRFLSVHGAALFWIVFLLVFGRMCIHIVRRGILKIAKRSGGDDALHARIKTVSHVVVTICRVALYTIIFFLILDVFGVDIRPFLAGAGIVGLAVGFGSQSLVRDVVAGFFILVENQYGIGDKVKIGAAEGVVKKITLRSTVLEDANGNRHYIANGSVNNVMNMA